MNKKSYNSIFLLIIIHFFFINEIFAKVETTKYTAGVLLASDIRLSPFKGLKDGLAESGIQDGKDIKFIVKNAYGKKRQLISLAKELIEAKPDIAIACGGIEADALKAATINNMIPVVFLSVSSSVDRGLVLSLRSSGNNMTGIDTADTLLTSRRLWFITKMFPKVKTVYILHVPSITPSVKSLEVAKTMAKKLNLKLTVETGEKKEELIARAESFTDEKGDAILLLPSAPVTSILKKHLFPIAMQYKKPIFGYGRVSIKNGAAASFAGSRYKNGFQSAKLVKAILKGDHPASIPIEKPENPEFVINKWIFSKLGINLPTRILNLADKILNEEIE